MSELKPIQVKPDTFKELVKIRAEMEIASGARVSMDTVIKELIGKEKKKK